MTSGPDLYQGNGDFGPDFFAGYDFAILQAHTGFHPSQDWFDRTAASVRAAGKVLGGYLFLEAGRDPVAQAQQFRAVVEPWNPELGYWVDFENNGPSMPTPDQLRAALGELPAGRCGFYSNGGQCPDGFDDYPWWAAGYPNVTPVPRPYVLHQYTSTPCDLSVVADDAWYAMFTHQPPPSPPLPPLTGDPAMPKRIKYQNQSHVFNVSGDGQLSHVFYKAPSWLADRPNTLGAHPEYRLDPEAAIDATTEAENQIDVYWRGAGGENGHTWWSGKAWGAELLPE